MLAIKLDLVLFLMIFHVSDCERRVKDGEKVVVDKKYVVYLIKAPHSKINYDYWLCGGAIVNSEFIITSAACVNDVDYLYVIAGYKKYVPDDAIETDKCTSQKKKKVIYTCSPKGYELKYEELDYWSYIDIALVKVESPYDFEDSSYKTYCSYIPTAIPINYEAKHQDPGTDAMVLGWGHTHGFRKPQDTKNYNEEILRYAPTLILNKNTCIEHYAEYANMSKVIESYMICSLAKGNIDDGGQTILKTLPLANGCTTDQQKVLGFEGASCEKEESYGDDDGDDADDSDPLLETRRAVVRANQTYNDSLIKINVTAGSNIINDFRRHGICQNDHGGPLVTWVGSREILIGVASVFKVDGRNECMGPYLYTSTLCTGLFLDCVLSTTFPEKKTLRRDLCDRPAIERGYETVERHISWKNHPAGPADNENYARSGPEQNFAANDAPNIRYTAKQRYPANEMYTESGRYVGNGTYPINREVKKIGRTNNDAGYAMRPQRPLRV